MTEKDAIVFDIQKFSVHDGPGIRTLVFLKGCPLRCSWCSNPESRKSEPQIVFYADKCIGCGKCLQDCPVSAISNENGRLVRNMEKCTSCGTCVENCYAGAWRLFGKKMSADEVIAAVEKDLPFYRNSGGGLTFGGGEPLLYPEFVKAVASGCKKNNITTAVETCGFVLRENFETVLDYIDLVMIDLKHMDPDVHRELTGTTNKPILGNLEKLSHRSDLEVVVRFPVIPGYNDSDENVKNLAEYVSSLGGSVSMIQLLPYHKYGEKKYEILGLDYSLKDVKAPGEEQMLKIKKIIENKRIKVQIGA